MRVMMTVSVPVHDGNRALADGMLPRTIEQFIREYKPEAAYFFPNGERTALFVLDLPDASAIPAAGEPFFMNLNASIEITPVMNADDLRAGLSRLKTGH